MRKSNSFEIGDRFKQLRINNGLNQTQFADKIGIQQSAVSAIEKGERLPTTDQIVTAANNFNVTSDWILFGDDSLSIAEVKEPPTEYSPEVKELLQVLEEVPTIRKSIEALAKLPERDQIIHLGEMLKNLKELEEK